MVSETIRWILTNTEIDPKTVADVWGIHENECWQYLIDLNRALREEEAAYDSHKVQTEMREWVETIPGRNNIRIQAIKEQLIDAKTNPHRHDVQKLLREVRILKGTQTTLTPEMIARAREFPITNLIENKRDTAICPFHNEKTPSLYLKNNFYHCFGCGANGDTIDLVMHTKGFTFKQAVEYLNQSY